MNGIAFWVVWNCHLPWKRPLVLIRHLIEAISAGIFSSYTTRLPVLLCDEQRQMSKRDNIWIGGPVATIEEKGTAVLLRCPTAMTFIWMGHDTVCDSLIYRGTSQFGACWKSTSTEHCPVGMRWSNWNLTGSAMIGAGEQKLIQGRDCFCMWFREECF